MIEFLSVRDAGDIDKERLLFRVTEAGDLGDWLVSQNLTRTNKSGDKKLQNTIRNSYWFIDTLVSVDDVVVLYTKVGSENYKTKISDAGRKTHFFYWELPESIWTKSDVAVVVGRFSSWFTTFIDEVFDDSEPT